MKIVLPLLLAASAAANIFAEQDEVLTLLQVRSVALDAKQNAAAQADFDYNDEDEEDFFGGKRARKGRRGKMGGKMGRKGGRGKMGRKGRGKNLSAKDEAKEAEDEAADAVELANLAIDEANEAQAEAAEAAAKAEVEIAVDPVPDTPVDPLPGAADEAEAVGDPHMTLSNGEHQDLCCDGMVCRPCPYLALGQTHEDDDEDILGGKRARKGRRGKMGRKGGRGKMGRKGRGKGRGKQVAKEAQDDAEEAVAIAAQALQVAQEAAELADEAAVEITVDPLPEEVADEAAAVGDPHMTLTSGEHKDLCCEGSVCRACTHTALMQQDEDEDIDEEGGKRARFRRKSGKLKRRTRMGRKGKGKGRGKTLSAKDEAKEAQDEAANAVEMAQLALEEAKDAQFEAEEAAEKAELEDIAVDPVPGPADEAAAVGDPHLTLNTGEHEDLCCEGSVCKPCSHHLALAEFDDDATFDDELLGGKRARKGRRGGKRARKGGKMGMGKRRMGRGKGQMDATEEAEDSKAESKDAVDLAKEAIAEAEQAKQEAQEALDKNAGDVIAPTIEVDPETTPEAEAVGDPHLTLTSGNKEDLCCYGGHCEPC